MISSRRALTALPELAVLNRNARIRKRDAEPMLNQA
jgi:hypothetical protein